jgi:hypothetical protein
MGLNIALYQGELMPLWISTMSDLAIVMVFLIGRVHGKERAVGRGSWCWWRFSEATPR